MLGLDTNVLGYINVSNCIPPLENVIPAHAGQLGYLSSTKLIPYIGINIDYLKYILITTI